MSESEINVLSNQGDAAKRLLVVDDELLVAMLTADTLGDLGYAVLGPASSLEEALRLATTGRIDGALLDWKLKGGSSEPVAELLTARGIPFVFLTGYDEISDPRFHNIALLRKPFLAFDLKRAVAEMLTGANRASPDGASAPAIADASPAGSASSNG